MKIKNKYNNNNIFIKTKINKKDKDNNQNKNYSLCPPTCQLVLTRLYTKPSIHVGSYQISIHLAKWFREDFFFNWPTVNKYCLWWPYQLHYWHEIWQFYTVSPIHNSYKVTIHYAFQFQRRFFQISANQKQEFPMMTMIFRNLPQMIPVKYCFIWLSGFREQELPMAVMFVNGLGRN